MAGGLILTAKEIIEEFSKGYQGRVMLGVEAAALLMDCVARTDGDYIEIGSAFGGSAIMAALAMGERAGTVYCIDNFLGVNRLESIDVVYEGFWKNIIRFGVQQRIVAFNQSHPPFPEPIHFHKFSVGLIDGDHLGEGPLKDFLGLDSRVTEYLLFDNAELEPVSATINAAIGAGDWIEYKVVEYKSPISDTKLVKFVALRRANDQVPEAYYDKMRHYMGDDRIPL